MRRSFYIGDWVEWKEPDQKQVKRGKVAGIVPPNRGPGRVFDSIPGHEFMVNPLPLQPDPRNHESYLVVIERVTARPKVYWPEVELLRGCETLDSEVA